MRRRIPLVIVLAAFTLLTIVIVVLTVTGWGTIRKFTFQLDEGDYFYHDIYVTNSSGRDLQEVQATLSVIESNGSRSEKTFYARWKAGQTIKIPS